MNQPAAQQIATVSPLREQAAIERGLAMDATSFEGIHSVFNNGTAFQLAVKMADMLANSTIMPEAYQGNPANCLIAIDYAARLRVSPVMLAQNMDVVKGRPGLRGTFLAGVINACPLFDRLKYEWRGTDNPGKEPSQDFGCRAYATELSSGTVLYGAWIDWRMVVAEKWNTNTKWTGIREQMFIYRATSFWSRAYASDVTLGLYEADELHDIHGGREPTRVTVEQRQGIDSLSERLKLRGVGVIEHAAAETVTDASQAEAASEAPTEPELTPTELKAAIFQADTMEQLEALKPQIAAIEDEAVQANVQDEYDVAVERLA